MAPRIQWPLVLFSLLAGTGGCLLLFAAITINLCGSIRVLFAVAIIALVLMGIGGICSIAHLATPKNTIWALAHIFSFSGISVELIMLGVTVLLDCTLVFLILFDSLRIVLRIAGMLGGLAGLVLAFCTGHGYLISSKPTWNTKKLPVAYTGTALSCGGFAYLVIALLAGEESEIVGAIVWLNLVAVFISDVSVAVYMNHIGPDRTRQVGLVYSIGILICVGVVPSFCAVAMLFLLVSPVMTCILASIGLFFSLIGAASLRIIMWIVGSGFLALFEEAQMRRSVLLND